MLTLALDTSSSQGVLAVASAPDDILEVKNWSRKKSHSEVLTSNIDAILKNQKISQNDIDVLAVGAGPGSFTGLRVGINFARAFAYSHRTPLLGIDSLRILAQPLLQDLKPGEKIPILALVNAFKNMVYVAKYNSQGHEILPPQAWTIERLEKEIQSPHWAVGDGYDYYKSRFSESLIKNLYRPKGLSDRPTAKGIIQLAYQEPFSSQTLGWRELKPLYIRASEAEEKLIRK